MAPPLLAILGMYLVLGGVVSFVFGRSPELGLPEHLAPEIAPTLIVICGFLVSYSIWDVMAVGLAKADHASKLYGLYKDVPDKMPEKVYLAQRVQTNQIEQLPAYLVGSIGCAVLVNGTVAAILSLTWAILRRCYASVYRSSVGVPLGKIGLARFTIPAYFCSNTMLMATAIQALRCYLA